MAFKEALEQFNESVGEDLITHIISGMPKRHIEDLYESFAIASDTRDPIVRRNYHEAIGAALSNRVSSYLYESHHEAYHDDKPDWCTECHPLKVDMDNDAYRRGE